MLAPISTAERQSSVQLSATGVSDTIAPERVERPEQDASVKPDNPWVTIVWNDPINLMSYVTYVLQQVFG